jgi:hypothetical protein
LWVAQVFHRMEDKMHGEIEVLETRETPMIVWY